MVNDDKLTLVDLLQDNRAPAEILETFRDYAETAAISYRSVSQILEKAKLSSEELQTAYAHMQTGLVKQIAREDLVNGLDYLQAMNHVARMLAQRGVVAEDAEPSDLHLLARLKADLMKAHQTGNRKILDRALATFRDYVLHANPGAFESGACAVKLAPNTEYSPGAPGLYDKGYNLARFGGFISRNSYLNLIQVRERDFEIVEGKK